MTAEEYDVFVSRLDGHRKVISLSEFPEWDRSSAPHLAVIDRLITKGLVKKTDRGFELTEWGRNLWMWEEGDPEPQGP